MFLQRIALNLFIIVFIVSFYSCEMMNPEEEIPSYIHIDQFTLNTQSDQGSNSSKITDAWVYVDDQIVGAYELPATIPILSEGNHEVMIKAGIKVNGISETRAIYPFYKPYKISLNLIPDSIITINPTITYYSETVFQWKEAFEDGGVTIENTIFSDTLIEKTSDPLYVFEGNYSGIVHLDANHTVYEGKSITSYDLPSGSNPVFLELNYKTENEVYIGLFANTSTESDDVGILHLNKTDTWKKIYINLLNAINNSTNATDFQVFFRIDKSSDVSNPVILFDNIKLVHF